MTEPKLLINVPASVLQRLYNVARAQGGDYNLLLSRFAVERFLYRLSISSHARGFTLKGAQLFALWSGTIHRSTRDVDLLGECDPAVAVVEHIFRSIAELSSAPNDGIVFDPESVEGEEIREDARYAGVRIRLDYHLGKARGRMQVDIGFGDVVTPAAEVIEYPTLLDFPAPRLKAYSRETVIAEKFEAMVTLGLSNSRMKDFYDIWMLSRTCSLDSERLQQAIYATFKRRGTPIPTDIPLALQPDFAADPTKLTQWNAFLRKNALGDGVPSLSTVLEELRHLLLPSQNVTISFSKENS